MPAGRKRTLSGPRVLATVSITEDDLEFLAEQGGGNVSAGVRACVKICMSLRAAAAEQRRAGNEPGDDGSGEASPVTATAESAPLGSPAVTGGAAQNQECADCGYKDGPDHLCIGDVSA